MNNPVPEGWGQSTLNDVSTNITKGTTPTTNGYQYTNSGVKFLRVENISHSGRILENDLKYISEEANDALRRSQLKAGDLLVSIAGAIGRSAIVDEKNLPANTNQAVGIVRLKPDAVNAKYVRYSIESPMVGRQMSDQQAGNAQVNLNLQQLGGLIFLQPPLPEQQKIATILSSVDNVIETTRAQIDKLKDLKTGMMQELLTKGIGSGGVPHTDFKDSPLGRIPANWEIKPLSTIVFKNSPICYGILMPGKYVAGGVPVIKVKDIKDGVIKEDNLLLTSKEIDQKNSRSRIKTGDILLTIRGTTGRIAVVQPILDGANITQDTARIRVGGDSLAKYMASYLQTPLAQTQIDSHTIGQAVKGINLEEVRRLWVVLPPDDERAQIADSLHAIDRAISLAATRLKSYVDVKKALMQDLLTGKVRVKIDEKEKEPAVA
jgi:type I restriction enzyme S subunit